MFAFDSVVPEGTSYSHCKDHDVIEEETEEEPNEKPKNSEHRLSCVVLVSFHFIVRGSEDAVEAIDPEESKENI